MSKQIKALYKKEMMDVLRDKKTVLIMVFLPLILYPVLFILVLQVVEIISTSRQTNIYNYAVYAEDKKTAKEFSTDFDRFIKSEEDGYDYEFKLSTLSDKKDFLENLQQEKLDAYLELSEKDDQIFVTIHFLSAVNNSSNCANYLSSELSEYKIKIAKENAVDLGVDVNKVIDPVVYEEKDESSGNSTMGNILGNIFPFLLIISVLMGCMYPAIDTTSGEKERGTLETLLTLPINNFELIMSKFLSVATIALFSVFMNMISIGGIALYLYATMKSFSKNLGSIHLVSFIPVLLISIVCVVVFALFMSAVFMCICAFAKSFKEANNYISPVMIVVMLIGYIGFIPNVELNFEMSVIPIVNIVLLLKSLLVFKYDMMLIIMVFFSNVLYAGISILVLSSIYNSESILFGESASGIKLFERRKNIKENSLPTAADGIFVYLVVLIASVYIGGILSTKNIYMSILVPQFFILILPFIACKYTKGNIKEVYRLKRPTIKDLFAGIILYIGFFGLSYISGDLIERAFPGKLGGATQGVTDITSQAPVFVAFLLIALLPAVSEELLFRGYLMTAFSGKYRMIPNCVITALLFGVMHLSLPRLLPLVLLGFCNCYAAYKSKSLIVSIIMHLINNSYSVFALYYGDKISFIATEGLMDTKSYIICIGLAVVCIPIGLLMYRKKEKSFLVL